MLCIIIFMNTKEIHLWNGLHLGDQIFSCIYFYNIKDYIEKENIKIYYYIPENYIFQVSGFIPSINIELRDIKFRKGLNVWIASNEIEYNWHKYLKTIDFPILDSFLVDFFNSVSNKLNIPVRMPEFKYRDNDLIPRYNCLPEKYKNLDFLIINSLPLSGQVDMTPQFINDMNNTIFELNNKYKIVTTNKLNEIHCTLDDSYTIKTIAAISTHAKIIIAINTGPLVGIFNEFTLNNSKMIYFVDKNCTFANKKFKRIQFFSEIHNSINLNHRKFEISRPNEVSHSNLTNNLFEKISSIDTNKKMIYFLVTTSLFNDCEIRKAQYINGINKLKQNIIFLNLTNYKIIIIENNGKRNTFLDSLDCEVFYTNNNFLNIEKGYKELKDILDCIEQNNINDTDFIVKMTGRYMLDDDSNFMNKLKNINNSDCDCIIRYGPYYNPVNYKMNDCITGLIGMRCYFVKQIEIPLQGECVEWKWGKVTYLIDDSKICILNSLGIYISPGSNDMFLV